jgi:hypothetical protein
LSFSEIAARASASEKPTLRVRHRRREAGQQFGMDCVEFGPEDVLGAGEMAERESGM